MQYTNNSMLPHNWHLFDGPDSNDQLLRDLAIGTAECDQSRDLTLSPRKRRSVASVRGDVRNGSWLLHV